MVPTILAVRPTHTVHSLVGRSGLNCSIESLCSFRKVVRVQECLPTTMPKILLSRAGVVQNALIDVGRFAVGPRRPKKAWYRIDDLAVPVFALLQCLLGALALRQIEDERDALVAALFEQRASNQYGYAAAISSEKFLLIRLGNRLGV